MAAVVAPLARAVRMTVDRQGRIWGLVAGEAASRGGRVSASDACAAAVAAVQVTGGWLSAASSAEPAGHLMSVTDAVSERLAELQLMLGEGPCPDAVADGGPVLASDLGDTEAGRRWPVFAPAARQAGAAAIFTFPLRIGAIGAGVMGLYRDRAGPLSDGQLGEALIFADAFAGADIRIGQALADVATISLLHERGMRRSEVLNEQLQTALNSRVVIEQAKGKLAERLGVDMDQAFSLLRDFARACFKSGVIAIR
ncbi:MAG TPA: GAF and ANTAR domain-containing protein [Streptosporangiaceae bacterium]|nr:GAF and ANTAR domain-containing protein [Streptosporangiaceae bacterium]